MCSNQSKKIGCRIDPTMTSISRKSTAFMVDAANLRALAESLAESRFDPAD
jgi:hypothetical protein